MLPLDQCVGRAEAGAKAERLARVRAAGLPALDGVVLLDGEAVDDAALSAALARLAPLGDGRFIVRSSSVKEDVAGASAAGVFASVTGARDLDEVKAAIAVVRASASDETARAYFATQSPLPMAVLIQPMARATTLGVAMSCDGGWLVEERRAGEPEWGDVESRRLKSDDLGALGNRLRALESLMSRPIDAEYAQLADDVVVLQVRPRARGPLESSDAEFASFAERGRWRLDAEHNPRPLSAAQAGLVALVDALGVGARQRVVGGWLFVEEGAKRGLSPLPLGELRRRFDDEVAPDCRRRFAAAADLGAALDAFLHMYRRHVVEVAPAISLARATLDQFLRAQLNQPLAMHGALLGGAGGAFLRRDRALWLLGGDASRLADYLREFGAWAPAWDVAAPPDYESAERVLASARALSSSGDPAERHRAAAITAGAAASELRQRLDPSARGEFDSLLPTARAAVEVGEDDDALFFEAQRLVRRALLDLQLPLAEKIDVFDLPLAVVRTHAADVVRSGAAVVAAMDWRQLAAQGRAARLAAERLLPPRAIEDGRPLPSLPPSAQLLRGHATAGRARGRAFVLSDPAQAPSSLPEGAVLVTPAILPSLAYLLPGCRALVTAHGGATSHGATLAREYGVPAVLGARGADSIVDGADLIVDGAAGRVYLLT